MKIMKCKFILFEYIGIQNYDNLIRETLDLNLKYFDVHLINENLLIFLCTTKSYLTLNSN